MASKLMLVAIAVATFGCARNHIPNELPVASARDETTTAVVPDQTDPIDDVLRSVLALPSINLEDSEAVPDTHASTSPNAIPIQTPVSLAADAERYFLQIDPNSDMVYILKRGGIADHLHARLGPWHSSNPQVATLIRLVQTQQKQ